MSGPRVSRGINHKQRHAATELTIEQERKNARHQAAENIHEGTAKSLRWFQT